MDMLVPYTPVSDLTEDQKKRLKAADLSKGFTIIDGKVVSTNEVKGTLPAAPAQRQNLFE